MTRRVIRFFLLLVVPAVALVIGAHFYVKGTRYVTTENAYVKANLVSVSPEIEGRIQHVLAKENTVASTGEVLFTIDPEPFRIRLQKANAELAKVKTGLAALRADYRQAETELREARQDISYFTKVFDRQKKLSSRGHASRARYDEAERNLANARQRAIAIRQKRERLLAELGGGTDNPDEAHPDYLNAVANRDSAELDLRRTIVTAPVDGVIGRVRVQPGEYVEPGDAVLPMVQAGEQWIEANLKETQLTHLKIGQQAEIVVDAYPDHKITARVASISPSTGAEFAVLPPQNASGNWVKVVQRVPVRLAIENVHAAVALRAGMTVTVSIDTERERSLGDVVGAALARLPGGSTSDGPPAEEPADRQ